MLQSRPLRYITVLLIYMAMQFSSLFLLIWNPFTTFGWIPDGLTKEEMNLFMTGQWGFYSFLIATILIVWITYQDFFGKNNRGELSKDRVFIWTIGGVFLAYGAQIFSGFIQMNLFDVTKASENTTQLMGVADLAPIFIPVICIFAPILEEIVFRGIIFKTVAEKTNFFVGVLVSALIFAMIHNDFTYIISYFTMGLVFAYLYHKTKRLIVPIIVHATMNSVVALMYLAFGDLIEDVQKQMQMIFFPF